MKFVTSDALRHKRTWKWKVHIYVLCYLSCHLCIKKCVVFFLLMSFGTLVLYPFCQDLLPMLYKKPAPHKTPILIYKPRFSCYKPYFLHWHSILYIAVSNIIYIQFSYRVCTVTNTTYMKRQLTEWIFILKLQMHSWLESFRSLNLVLTCKTTFTQVEYRKAQFNICKNLKHICI